MIILFMVFIGFILGTILHSNFPDMSPYFLVGISFSPLFFVVGGLLINMYSSIHKELGEKRNINRFFLPIVSISILIGILTGGFLLAIISGIAVSILTHVIGKMFSKLTS